ncbi:HalX domain-containing protein [Natronomonas sp.]|uniref:HalX domain-containing protein n=1 Tax=Natronomonas sp. TaxID=2184060 RepID=UPI002FC2BF4B
MSEETSLTVLIADDEPGLADGHAARLSEHDVRTAYDGPDALEKLSEGVDIALLDRRMPGLSGDEVLEHLRERGRDCRVAMLTGVEPDVDIVSMGFDEYLTKPLSREELHEAIERMKRRSTYDAKLQEYFSLASKRAALETDHSPDGLADQPQYHRLCERLASIRNQLDDALDELPERDGYAVAAEPNDGPGNRSDDRLDVGSD